MDTDSPAQAQERHVRFIRSALSKREVWALKNDVGLATWSDDEAESAIVPLWSDRESAATCAAASFPGYSPERFELEFLIMRLLPELEKNDLWVSTNPTAQMTGVDVPAARLLEQINQKRAEQALGPTADGAVDSPKSGGSAESLSGGGSAPLACSAL